MKKRIIINKLLAIKSPQYNSEFHSDYKRQKRISPLMKTVNDLPKINHEQTIKKNILFNIKYPTPLTLENSSRNKTKDNTSLGSPLSETEQVIYPKIFQNNFYKKDTYSSLRKKIGRKNSGLLSMKYLDLFNESKEYNFILWNRLIQNEDNFFENEILEKITDINNKQKIISELKKFDEKENKIMENFVRKNLNKNTSENEPFLLIEKLPNEIISNYGELIYKEYLNINYNINKEIIKNKKNNVQIKRINNPKLYNKLIIHNVYLEFVLKNVRKRIEIRNQYNKELTLEYVIKLIIKEIKKLKLMILKVQNFSNENNKFSTFDLNKEQLQMNSPISSRYYKNTDIKFHNLINRSLRINHPLNLGYMVKNSDYTDFKNKMGNINNNDNMYITGVKKDYQTLLQNNNIDLNSINKLNSTINLDNKKIINKNYYNINTTSKQFYDIYNNKRIRQNYNFNINDNNDSKIPFLQKKIIQINENKLNNKINETHFSNSIDLSKYNEDDIQKLFKQDNSNEKNSKNENNIKIINNEESNSSLVNIKNKFSQNKNGEGKKLNKNNGYNINNNKENTIKKIIINKEIKEKINENKNNQDNNQGNNQEKIGEIKKEEINKNINEIKNKNNKISDLSEKNINNNDIKEKDNLNNTEKGNNNNDTNLNEDKTKLENKKELDNKKNNDINEEKEQDNINNDKNSNNEKRKVISSNENNNNLNFSNNNLTKNNNEKKKNMNKIKLDKKNINFNKNKDDDYESDFTVSVINNNQNFSTSQNSDEQVILKDKDIDKLLKMINKDKKDKLKKIQKNEDNNNNNNYYNYSYKRKPDYNSEDDEMTRADLLEKIRINDLEIREYLMKLMYSNLVNKKNLTKKKNINLIFKGDNNEVFKISGNINFMKNFHRQYSNNIIESEDDNTEEEEEEESEESKSNLIYDNLSSKKRHFKTKMGKEIIRKDLVYDNKYLFKSDDDDEDEKLEIKKEVQDILNGIYTKSDNNEKQLTPEEEELNNEQIKKKIEEKFLESYYKKRKFMKRKRKKNKKKLHSPQKKEGIFIDEEMDNEMYMKRQRIYERDEFYELIKNLKDKNLDWRINYFFDKVKEWSKTKKNGFITEMDKYVEFDMKDFKMKRDKEIRIRDFILGLNDYRVTRKVQRKLFDTYIYKQPVLIENYSAEKYNKSWNSEDKIKDKKKDNKNKKSSKSLK